MKKWQYGGLLAAIWISPVNPDIINLIIGLICFGVAVYYTQKDE